MAAISNTSNNNNNNNVPTTAASLSTPSASIEDSISASRFPPLTKPAQDKRITATTHDRTSPSSTRAGVIRTYSHVVRAPPRSDRAPLYQAAESEAPLHAVAREVDVQEENAKRRLSNAKNECASASANHDVDESSPRIGLEDGVLSPIIRLAMDDEKERVRLSWTCAIRFEENTDGTDLVLPENSVRTIATNSLWNQWCYCSQAGCLYECDASDQNMPIEMCRRDDQQHVPVPVWIADGLRKYFILGLCSMLHLRIVNLRAACDRDSTTPFVVHMYEGYPCCIHVALQQSLWAAVGWWQSQVFDIRIKQGLYGLVESIADDEQLYHSIYDDTENLSSCMSQLLLDVIPSNAEDIQSASEYPYNHMQSAPSHMKLCMDMRGWSLTEVAMNLMSANPVHCPSYWFDVQFMSKSLLDQGAMCLVLMPALCTALRRMNLLEAVFYGYETLLNTVRTWRSLVLEFAHNTRHAMPDIYANRTTYGSIEYYNKQFRSRVRYLLSRVIDDLPTTAVPRDVRRLYYNVSMELLEKCALVSYACSVDAWQTAQQQLVEADRHVVLACLVRSAAVHWGMCDQSAQYARGASAMDFTNHTWMNIDHLLPKTRNPILANATLKNNDLVPKDVSVVLWSKLVAQRQSSSAVSIHFGKVHTRPTDLAHLMAMTSFHVAQQSRKLKCTTLLISSGGNPDLVLHYDSNLRGDPNTPNAPSWILIEPNHLDQSAHMTQFEHGDGAAGTTRASSTTGGRSDGHATHKYSESPMHGNTFQSHLTMAQLLAPKILSVIPHTYMFETMHVTASALNVDAYLRVTRDNALQQVARTMPRSVGV